LPALPAYLTYRFPISRSDDTPFSITMSQEPPQFEEYRRKLSWYRVQLDSSAGKNGAEADLLLIAETFQNQYDVVKATLDVRNHRCGELVMLNEELDKKLGALKEQAAAIREEFETLKEDLGRNPAAPVTNKDADAAPKLDDASLGAATAMPEEFMDTSHA